MSECVFCKIDKHKEKIVLEDKSFIAVLDSSPVTKGHTIVITKKHIISFFEMNATEFADFYAFIEKVKKKLDSKYDPDGYNIGHNEGKASGGSIQHLHIHIIPRYSEGEGVPGGIRNVLGRRVPLVNNG